MGQIRARCISSNRIFTIGIFVIVKVKSMEHKTKIKLGVQNKDEELLTEPALILDRWFEYIGDLYEDEKSNTLNHRKEKATLLDKETRDIIEQITKNKATG